MVSPTTRAIIWARTAGHCQYPGCNDSLIGDLVSGTEDANFGLIAHIVASTPGGPRGDPVRSPALADDPANLMLLCYRHHKLIDVEGLAEHSEQRLIEMKAAHESRIQIVTAIVTEKSSHVLRYGASIGAHDSPISYRSVAPAMLPERYPAGGSSIGIEILEALLKILNRSIGQRSRRIWNVNSMHRFVQELRPAKYRTCPCSGWHRYRFLSASAHC